MKIHIHTKDASEEINLSKVLAEFPGLKAYGLSKITYAQGEVILISVYDIPRVVVQSIGNYVRTIKTVKDKRAA